MPSKKTSKNHPKFSSSGQTIGSSPFPATISSPLEPTYDQLLSSLDEASAKFPSLVSRTAFVGTLVDGAISVSPGCKVWLSESALLAYAIPPGSLVSVSLSSLEKGLGISPLSSLSDECARQFGLELPSNFSDEAGNFFALATVFPSTKVLKNGVRLSLNLSYTMGCPTTGRTVFVYPIKHHPSIENGNGNQCGLATSCCKELYLTPVCLKGNFEVKCVQMSYLDSSKGVELDQVQDTKSLSPKTPSLSQSKLSSPCSASHATNYDKSASKSTDYSHASTDVLDTEHILGDDSSRRLMETCITSWLNSRILLSRNFVIVPILSGLCVFQVLGSKEMLSRNDLTDQALDLGKDKLFAFPINSDMKICLLSQGNPIIKTSGRYPLAHPELEHLPDKSSREISHPKLGGLSKEFAELKDIIVSSAVHVTLTSLGLRPTKGVLIHGPPGTGKTTLARECAHRAGIKLFSVNGPEIISQFHGETEQALHEVFNKASQASPSIVLIDELDAIAPARKDGGDELSQRMVATLLNLMDGINRNEGMLIIAVTNRPDSIEPALRRPGRLDREIEIGVPSPSQRHEILAVLLSEMHHSLLDKDIQDLAMNAHGFVGADLAALCNEAALVCLRRYVKSTTSECVSDFEVSTTTFSSVRHTASESQYVPLGNNLEDHQNFGDPEKNNYEVSCSGATETEKSSDFNDGSRMKGTHASKDILGITSNDFEKARVKVQPSAMREVSLEVPKVCWEDVGGQMEVKAQLMEAVQWPQKHRDAFERIGTRPPSGILLFGPPGCSKTLLARAVASEAGLNFLAVKGPELFSKWVGESEKAVRTLFAKARANSPSIIFFDEIDGLAIIRGKESDGVSVGDRVISQLLVELDGLQQRGSVTVIAATNRPDKIDPALLRPGRFDRLLYVGPPNRNDREDIFRVHLHQMPCNSDVCISELSLLTEGCTGADISLICREAAIAAMEENLSASEISMKHLKVGLQQVQPTDVRMYEKLSTKFQRLVLSTAKEDDLGCEPHSDNPSHIPLWSRMKYAASSLFAFHS